MGDDVMELQEALLGAAPPIAAHESAAPAVAEPDCALHLGRDVTRAGGSAASPAWAVRSGELLPGQVLQERRQGPIEDLAQIPVRDLVAQEGLRKLSIAPKRGVGWPRSVSPLVRV